LTTLHGGLANPKGPVPCRHPKMPGVFAALLAASCGGRCWRSLARDTHPRRTPRKAAPRQCAPLAPSSAADAALPPRSPGKNAAVRVCQLVKVLYRPPPPRTRLHQIQGSHPVSRSVPAALARRGVAPLGARRAYPTPLPLSRAVPTSEHWGDRCGSAHSVGRLAMLPNA